MPTLYPSVTHHSEGEHAQAVVKSLFMPVRIGVVFTGLFYDEAKWRPIEAQICLCFLHKARTSGTQPLAIACGAPEWSPIDAGLRRWWTSRPA